MDAMKEFQAFIHRDSALLYLVNENWDLEDALAQTLSDRGINHDTKFVGQSNASTVNMTGIQMLESFNINRC